MNSVPRQFLLIGLLLLSATALADPYSFTDPSVFQWQFYLDMNSDLRPAGITDQASATSHWLNAGIYEGRRAIQSFSALDYLARYPDLQAAFGTNYPAAIMHYLTNGRSEGRIGTVPISYGLNFGNGNSTFGNEQVAIRTSSAFAGSVNELWWHGAQFINDHDTGRLFQTAFFLDGLGECENPTEGGAARDGSGPSESIAQYFQNGPGSLVGVTQPAYWQIPGTQTGYCGMAQGVGTVSNSLIWKSIQVGYGGDPQLISWNTTVALADDHQSMTVVPLTGYETPEFNQLYLYDPYSHQLDPVGFNPLENGIQPNIAWHSFPPVLSTADGQAAIGVISLDQEASWSPRGVTQPALYETDSLLQTPDLTSQTTIWNIQFKYGPVPAGNYQFQTVLAIGTLSDVLSRMQTFYATNPNQAIALLSSPDWPQGFSPGYYYLAYPDLAAAFGPNPDPLTLHYFQNGIFEGRSGSAQFNARDYMSRYPDLQAAFGPSNLVDAYKHFLTHGISEGRDGQ